MRRGNESPLGQRDSLVLGGCRGALEGPSLEVEACGLQPARPRRQRLTRLPFAFPDGSSEKSAEENTTQSHRGVVSAQLHCLGGERRCGGPGSRA